MLLYVFPFLKYIIFGAAKKLDVEHAAAEAKLVEENAGIFVHLMLVTIFTIRTFLWSDKKLALEKAAAEAKLADENVGMFFLHYGCVEYYLPVFFSIFTTRIIFYSQETCPRKGSRGGQACGRDCGYVFVVHYGCAEYYLFITACCF